MYEVPAMIQKPKSKALVFMTCIRKSNTCSCHDQSVFFVQPCTQCCHSQCWLQWCGPRGRAWRCLSTQLSDSHVEVRPSSLGAALFIFMIRPTLKRKDSSSPLWLLTMRQQLIQENTSATMSSATTLKRLSSTFMCQVGSVLSFCPSYCTSWIVAVMLFEKNYI